MRIPMILAAVGLASVAAQAAPDLEAGKAKVQSVCAACHGVNGVSVADAIPNLAAQKAAYLEGQLKALKDGSRKNPVMNAIAAQLSADDIVNVAAYFALQPGASAASAKSEFLPQLAKTPIAVPEDYKSSFVKYHVIDFPATRQVRHYWANPAVLKAAKAGQPLPDGSIILAEIYTAKLDADKQPLKGGDGHFVADQFVGWTAMQREAGWGQAVPEMLRNENWLYAAFTPQKQARPVNQAECLACHKPLDKTSFTFTLEQVTAAAKAR